MEEIFRALSSNTRIEILRFLAEGKKTVTELVMKFSLTQPTISHHLKVLKEVGLVVEKRYKKWIYYSLNNKVFENVKSYIENLFRRGGDK